MIKRFVSLALILLINAVVIAFLLEVGLRLAAPVLPQRLKEVALTITTGTAYEQTWTPAWQRNREHYYALTPNLVDVLQYGSPSVTFRLSTIELWDGGGIGFRTRPVDYFVDAVVVGDSFGFCFTEVADCWVTHLEAQLNMGIVNLSQPVTGTTSHARILRDFGQPLTPPLVIWQFFGNDFNDDYGLAVSRQEIEPLPDDTATQAEANAGLSAWLSANSVAYAVLEVALTGRWGALPQESLLYDRPYRVTYGEHALQFGGLYEQYALDMARPINQAGLTLSRTAFQDAQTLIESWGGRLVVVMIPTREEVYAHLTAPIMGQAKIDALTSSRLAMHGLCSELDLACYDPYSAFVERAQNQEALYYVDDMHLNAHGNAVLATAFGAWLQNEQKSEADS